MKLIRWAMLSTVALAMACGVADTRTPQSQFDGMETGAVIPGQYIVVLDAKQMPQTATGNVDRWAVEEATFALRDEVAFFEPTMSFAKALQGFAMTADDDVVARLENDPRVLYVEPDRVIRMAGPPCDKHPNHPQCQDPTPTPSPDPSPTPSPEPTPPASQTTPWGITRVGGAGNGTGNTIWIIDTGIDLAAADLNVDASRGFNAFTRGRDSKSLSDNNGHGTHVSGTAAAIDNGFGVVGVAAGATVVPVKVLDSRGSGSYSGVIAGVDYVASNASAGDAANMSLGGPVSASLDSAVLNAANGGVLFALAAGNESDDCDNHSPGRVGNQSTNVYTVSAIDDTDTLAYFSNYGACVDVAAPGVDIESLQPGGSTVAWDGTSMASPHVAGILSLGAVNTDGTANGDPDGNPDPIAHR